VQGLWKLIARGEALRGVGRSPAGTLLAAASTSGELLVMNAPCVEYSDARTMRALAHSGSVANASVLSAGASAPCVL